MGKNSKGFHGHEEDEEVCGVRVKDVDCMNVGQI